MARFETFEPDAQRESMVLMTIFFYLLSVLCAMEPIVLIACGDRISFVRIVGAFAVGFVGFLLTVAIKRSLFNAENDSDERKWGKVLPCAAKLLSLVSGALLLAGVTTEAFSLIALALGEPGGGERLFALGLVLFATGFWPHVTTKKIFPKSLMKKAKEQTR